MARYGSNVVGIKVTTSSSTGSYQDISQSVRELTGFPNPEAMLQPGETFGDTWNEQLYVGMNRQSDFTIRAYYDDAGSTSPHAIFGAIATLGAERAIKVNMGTTNEYPKTRFLVKSYSRLPRVGELTGVEIVCAPTGALTYATT